MNLAAAMVAITMTATAAISPAEPIDRVGPPMLRPSVAQSATRPSHATMRYNSATAASCGSLSDTSSQVCLLLAIAVVRMGRNPMAALGPR